jgi:hypothetical protein
MPPDEPITDAMLAAFLSDSLPPERLTAIEQRLRGDEPLRLRLRAIVEAGARGEHSIAAIWQRHRVSCPERQRLGSYLLGALDREEFEYIAFHLEVIGCVYCNASVADLRAARQQQSDAAAVQRRRDRFYESRGH